VFAATVVLAALVSGCGGLAPLHSSRGRHGVTRGAADPSAIAVIKGWANALRRGNVRAAAGYFAIPSLYANTVDARGNLVGVRIRSRAGAVIVNRELPCGAIFVSAAPHGPYIRVVFRLTGRPGPGGTSCNPGAGAEATTFFRIQHGKIADWIRGPDVSGRGTGTVTGTGTGTTPGGLPTTTPGGGVPVA
jgi:hypothetical protein